MSMESNMSGMMPRRGGGGGGGGGGRPGGGGGRGEMLKSKKCYKIKKNK